MAVPARSSNLTPLDLFLRADLEDKVYSKKPKTNPSLKHVIRDEIQIINDDEELLQKVCRSVMKILQKCIKIHENELFLVTALSINTLYKISLRWNICTQFILLYS